VSGAHSQSVSPEFLFRTCPGLHVVGSVRVTEPLVPPPSRPWPAVTPVMSPTDWHVTEPSALITLIALPSAHVPLTILCRYVVSAFIVTSPDAPPPLMPTPAITDVTSPPLLSSVSQATVPSS